MRLELEILDGKNKGRRLSLRSGLLLGNEQGGVPFDDKEMASSHAVIIYDQKNSWNIEALAPNKIRLGFNEVSRATLIMGLIFHLGQTGFKVVERPPRAIESWQNEIKSWLEDYPALQTESDIFFFLNPIRLSFVQGPQYEEVYTLSYGPREIGYNNIDLNMIDPAAPPKVAKFFQVGDQAYIENLCGDLATINKEAFSQHPIKDGDLLRIASCVIKLGYLNDDNSP